MGKFGQSPAELVVSAMKMALEDAGLQTQDVGALLCGPTIRHSAMFAHVVAHTAGLRPSALCKTIDCGGASPCVAVMDAVDLLEKGSVDVVVVAAGDAVLSMPKEEFGKLVMLGGAKPVRWFSS
jgi:acetyl-CoA acetyltransferase